MRASVQAGQSTDTRSQQLRVYPNAAQEDWMELACRARQWAYNFGTKVYRSQWRDRFEQISADPSCMTQVQAMPKPKRLSGNSVSRLITTFLTEIKESEAVWKKQSKWIDRYYYKLGQQQKKHPGQQPIPLTPVELRAAYEADKKLHGWSGIPFHGFSMFLARCSRKA
jgi:hypothetical protein